MYCDKNYATKKELKADVKAYMEYAKNPDLWKLKNARPSCLNAGTRPPRAVTYYQPGGMFPAAQNGSISLEGPHYPKPHRWYAAAVAKNGVIVSVK